MDRFERLYELHSLLDGRRSGVSLADIANALDCSEATAKRAIRTLRSNFEAPLRFDADRGGYFYDTGPEARRFELPGIWLSAAEIASLALLRELLARLEPGLLEETLAPLARRLDRVARHRHLGLEQLQRRIRLLSQQSRAPGPWFREAATATLTRRQLAITYHGRADDRVTRRTVSPQRLTRYRGGWYLDAWCHTREGLRSFAVERIRAATLTHDHAREIPDAELDAHFAAAYGIFTGPADREAVLVFSAERARWVAEEKWHPDQKDRLLADGRYELRLPLGRADELVLDVMRFGADVEVVAPADLRAEVARRHREAAKRYDRDAARKDLFD